MLIARWSIMARYGLKQPVIDNVKWWWEKIGSDIGQTDYTIITGSIGASEALVSVDVRIKDLAELDAQWAKLSERMDHKDFADELEPLIVSGSTKWEIFRVVH